MKTKTKISASRQLAHCVSMATKHAANVYTEPAGEPFAFRVFFGDAAGLEVKIEACEPRWRDKDKEPDGPHVWDTVSIRRAGSYGRWHSCGNRHGGMHAIGAWIATCSKMLIESGSVDEESADWYLITHSTCDAAWKGE